MAAAKQMMIEEMERKKCISKECIDTVKEECVRCDAPMCGTHADQLSGLCESCFDSTLTDDE